LKEKNVLIEEFLHDFLFFFVSESLEENTSIYKQAINARNRLIEQLAEIDDEVAEAFLDGKCFLFVHKTSPILNIVLSFVLISLERIGFNVPVNILKAALRRVTLQNKGVIVLCGSSLKYKVSIVSLISISILKSL
jgi:translation elongation factor EF-G